MQIPETVTVRRDGKIFGNYGDSTDPFLRDEDGLYLAEAFARAPFSGPRTSRDWFLRKGVVAPDLVYEAPPKHHFETQIVEVREEQVRVRWLLKTLLRLSDTQNDKASWDPEWCRPVLWSGGTWGIRSERGQAEFAPYDALTAIEPDEFLPYPIGSPPAPWPSPVRPTTDPPTYVEYRAFPTRRLIGSRDRAYRRVAIQVVDRLHGGAEILPIPDEWDPTIPGSDGLFDELGFDWTDALAIGARLVSPYVSRAQEAEVYVEASAGKVRLVERRLWKSLDLPVYLQLYEALQRVSAGLIGAALCRECGEVIIVLDARRIAYCSTREAHRRAERLRWRDAHSDALKSGRP